MADINIVDLRGGANDRHPATIADNYVEQAWNVTFNQSQLGARRNGHSTAFAHGFASGFPIALIVHTPDSTTANEQLWAYATNGVWRRFSTAFAATTVTPSPADTFSSGLSANATWPNAVSLHGKLFIAAQSDVARLHVYDGTTLRRVGLAAPATPAVANQGGGGYTDVRRFRVRYAVVSGGATILRSEPSAETVFTPSGAAASARVTKSAAISEGETHWEIEESVDGGANWYRLAQVVVGTTTYDDSLVSSAVASTGVLSADIGDYSLPPSARYVAVDRDRVVMGGDFSSAAADSDIRWTPVGSDTSGVGNDERVPTDTTNKLTLDGQHGGRLTGMKSFDTQIIAFKFQRVYLLTHTGSRTSAYRMDILSTTYGALEGSVVEGVDEEGRAALYFLDPRLGPMRYGAGGFTQLAPQQQTTFASYVNTDTTSVLMPSNSVYYPIRKEVWWHIAQVDATTSVFVPTLRLVYNTETHGVSWQYLTQSTDLRTSAADMSSAVLWQKTVYLGMSASTSIVKADVAGATVDLATYTYRAWVRTKAYAMGNLRQRFGVKGGVLNARPTSGVSVSIKAIRDYGLESSVGATALLTPTGTERFVNVPMDDLTLSELTTVQFEMGDSVARSVAAWSLEQLTVRTSMEGTQG